MRMGFASVRALCLACADKAGADSAAHPLFQGNLAAYPIGRSHFRDCFEHGLRTTGVDDIRLACLQLLLQQGSDKPVRPLGTVIRGEQGFGAGAPVVLFQDDRICTAMMAVAFSP